MGTAEHTPGPWILERIDRYRIEICNEETLFTVAYMNGSDLSVRNARLIAAAPELLAALEDVLTSESGPSLNDRVRAAIAKAKGA